ncbi:HNH endonuclease signature motif containing protein [Mycobacterium sp. CVI_P3]|uniref:HNH endonuclease signature motif containing protein n=1 Tax=Mycobacterium pinniadriaticum TaxID=2994102 RepID=A0ABT3SAZ2_9MYCO|nr:HNH endonuclease signature motif containing protein [Mycobacterium pinniadriaticum]MCX2930257.1 HNH endonuclease signature motif containing protein [Mycobacterium pinniadriaticum]MCX2936681.1 HNH endonuclease signature motif containing protein [Mycobacterium pinniadriaticum]
MGPLTADEAHRLVRAELDAVDAAYDRLRAVGTDLVGNAFRIEVAERLERQHRTNRGLSYRLFGEIAEPVDSAVRPAGVKVREVLSSRLRLTAGEVKRRFRVASRIRARRSLSGPPLAPELPALADAVEAGEVGEDHIAAVCRALDRLPSAVAPADREAAERALVRHARKQDSQFVTEIGIAIGDCLNPDGMFTDEDRARRRGLVLGRQGPDGMSRLSGWLDPEARTYLEAVAAAVRPGRHLADDTDERDTRTPEQRCHDGLKLGLKAAVESRTLGQHRGLPVTVVVTTTLGELEQAAGWARTGGAGRLPMRDLIRMAREAVHYLAVFDDHSDRPLYLGRAKRLATADHRIICYARDRGCTKPNCFEPGYHSEIHHALPWSEGGRTDADNLYFGCACDHMMATEGRYTTTVTENGRLAWSDGIAPPRVNDAHHPERLLNDDGEPPR